MIPDWLAGPGWFLLGLLPFLVVQRWLHHEIQAVFLLLTRRADVSLGLFSLLFLPGVFLHEASHYITARLTGVRTGRFSILPRLLPDKSLRLGYVETAQTDIFRDALIGTAPLMTGGTAIALIGIHALGLSDLPRYLNQGEWSQIGQLFLRLPGQPDFWLWFYLAFAISSTMLPSASDRRAWLPLLAAATLVLGLAVLAGAGPWMALYLRPWAEKVFMALAGVFLLSLGIHVVLVVPVWLLRVIISRITGLTVQR